VTPALHADAEGTSRQARILVLQATTGTEGEKQSNRPPQAPPLPRPVTVPAACHSRASAAQRGSAAVGVRYRPGSKFLSIVRQTQMVSSGDNEVYTSSGLRGVISYVQCVAAVFLSQVCDRVKV
jgi:hypothetical protein